MGEGAERDSGEVSGRAIFTATPGLPIGSVIVVEQKNIERLEKEIAPDVREIARFSSGLEPSKKDMD
jgi:hypothetical protein